MQYNLISICSTRNFVTVFEKNIQNFTYTVGTEIIQTPLNFSLFVILQPFAKII